MGTTRLGDIPGLIEEAILPGGQVPLQGIYEQSLTKLYRLGTRLVISDRVFRYAKAGGTLVAGKLCESAAFGGSSATLQTNLAIPTASAVGDNFGYATLATDAAVVNLYEDGWYSVYDGNAAQGVGQTFQIKSHPAVLAGGNGKFTFYDKIPVLISASAKAALHTNIYKAVTVRSSTPVGIPVGVPLIAVTDAYYCWLQTWGPVVCLGNGILTYEMAALAGTGVDGATDIQVAGASSVVSPEIAFVMATGADTKYGLLFLRLAA